jgi:outer membrane protein TolC
VKPFSIVLALVVIALPSCVAHPPGEREERERALEAGRAFEDEAAPPELPEHPSLDDYLRAAFHANAELRQRYWEWRAALERVPEAASPPNAALSFAYLFSSESMKAWDRTTLGLSNDAMTNVPLPPKLALAGRRALEEARAAGRRFEAAKFRLQAQVLSLHHDLALHAEQIRIQEAEIDLLALARGEASARVATGSAAQEELLRAESELALARNDLANLHAQLPPMAAQMNALLGRAASAPVPLPEKLPEPRPLPATDDELLLLAAERSPELAALAHEVAGREEGLELARKARWPDINLSFSLTGTLSQTLGAMVVLPTRVEAIRAGIERARAELAAAEAARVRYARDLAASFVLDLYVLRNAERQAALFQDTLVPLAELIARASETGLGTGRTSMAEVVEARRALLDARLVQAMLRVEREKALAAIETWSALDVEALHPVRSGAEI